MTYELAPLKVLLVDSRFGYRENPSCMRHYADKPRTILSGQLASHATISISEHNVSIGKDGANVVHCVCDRPFQAQ